MEDFNLNVLCLIAASLIPVGLITVLVVTAVKMALGM